MSSPYRRHVLVCTHGKVCPEQGGFDLHRALKDAVARRGLHGEIRVNKAGCLAQCGWGPMVVVYPENRWYAGVTAADLEAFVAAEIERGEPLDSHLYTPAAPGKNIVEAGVEPGTVPRRPPAEDA